MGKLFRFLQAGRTGVCMSVAYMLWTSLVFKLKYRNQILDYFPELLYPERHRYIASNCPVDLKKEFADCLITVPKTISQPSPRPSKSD